MKTLCCLFAFALAAAPVRANDWPNWRGPDHNGISKETGWQAKWPADGPSRLWKTSVGTGFSSVTVSQGRLFTMGNQKDTDTVFCFDAETGKPIWKYSYPCPTGPLFYEGGTSATPTDDGGKIFTLSRRGDLFCLNADDGKVVWSNNVAKSLKLDIPTWGFSSSALIEGNLLLLNVGSHGAAFDKTTGKSLWASGASASGYSTPVPCAFDGKPAVALMGANGAYGVETATGKELWERTWPSDYAINIADPIVAGDDVFVSSSYGKIGALVKIQDDKAQTLWDNTNLQTQLTSPVLIDGYLYGVCGNSGPTPNAWMACVEWKTGALKWTFPDLGGGAVTAADGKLIALSDHGELFTAEASPQGFNPISRTQVLGGRCWTVPVLANGRIYCRNARGDLVCLDVKPH